MAFGPLHGLFNSYVTPRGWVVLIEANRPISMVVIQIVTLGGGGGGWVVQNGNFSMT